MDSTRRALLQIPRFTTVDLAIQMKMDGQAQYIWPDIVLSAHTLSFDDPLYEDNGIWTSLR